MRVTLETQDTRTNKEDFAITPYLCGIKNSDYWKPFFGLGLCWGWWAIAIVIHER